VLCNPLAVLCHCWHLRSMKYLSMMKFCAHTYSKRFIYNNTGKRWSAGIVRNRSTSVWLDCLAFFSSDSFTLHQNENAKNVWMQRTLTYKAVSGRWRWNRHANARTDKGSEYMCSTCWNNALRSYHLQVLYWAIKDAAIQCNHWTTWYPSPEGLKIVV